MAARRGRLPGNPELAPADARFRARGQPGRPRLRLVEKYRAWSDCGGDVLSVWPREKLIDTIMIYWTTNTIASPLRYYYDAVKLLPALHADDFMRAPTGITMWPHDLALAPREMAERLYNVSRYTVLTKGGHFPAWEAPELYAEDLRLLLQPVRADAPAVGSGS